ncbi:MAG: hypothetical protein WD768_04665 [Phycisphaeraceae bacterium]
MDANRFWSEITNTFRRVVRSNFQVEQASTAERVKLASSAVPLTDPLVQNYAVWRKAVLWIAAIALIILQIVHLISFESAEEFVGPANKGVVDGVQILILLSGIVGTILIVIAAALWANVPLSKRLARWGWLIMFVMPFLLAIMPLTMLMDMGDLEGDALTKARMGVGLMIGLYFFMQIGPKGLALFAGIIRSSMTLKTLLPESSAPGWATILFAPLYALFFVVITSFVIQIGGNVFLLLSCFCFITAPLVYVFKAAAIGKPQTGEEVTRVLGRIRMVVSILALTGTVFLIISLAVSGLFDFWEAFKFFLGFVSSTMALTVVASDFILALIFRSYEQGRKFQESPHRETLEAKFQALSTVGLTRLISWGAFTPPAAPAAPSMPAVSQTADANVEVSLESVVLDSSPEEKQ